MKILRHLAPDGSAALGIEHAGEVFTLDVAPTLGALLSRPLAEIRAVCEAAVSAPIGGIPRESVCLLPPVDGHMEVWASGVTYHRSRQARVEESSGSGDVYTRVYDAERPELFFKSAAWRVTGDGEQIAVRRDSNVNVPEPELALVLNAAAEVVGFTICNDVSSRSIEGANPLYLPQAKVYLGGCAVGPTIRPVWQVPDPLQLGIEMTIRRDGEAVWSGAANTSGLRRGLEELAGFLFREESFPHGVVLSTGTCLVPELPMSLEPGDQVEIVIDDVGTLRSTVCLGKEPLSWLADRLVRRASA